MKTTLNFTLVCLMVLNTSLSNAQDTIKLGVNSEIINVVPPEMNHKVYVLIEDSAFNYHIDILKLPKSVSSDYSNGLLANDNKKKKKYTSALLNEIEMGAMFIPVTTYTQVNWGSRSETDPYLQEIFLSEGSMTDGFYASINIRSKKRLLTKSQKLYFGNATQLKLNTMRFQGDFEYRETFGITNTRNYDSIGRIDTITGTIDIKKLMFVKRLAVGWIFNSKSNFSVEYGLDINVKFYDEYETNRYSVPAEFRERMKTLLIHSNPSFAISNPTFSLYHRIGVNYKKFTVNAGLSNGKVKMGTYSNAKGRMVNVGLAYRIR